MSYVVALTGGIGSGKSTIANIFASLGAFIIDADILTKQIVQPNSKTLSCIIRHFGNRILNSNGTLNSSILREIIFNIPKEKLWLNQLIHPLIKQLTKQKICAMSQYVPYIIWVIPLLIENNWQSYVDRILVVDVITEIQISRTINRDNINHNLIKKILAAQTTRQHRLLYANDIIDNNSYLKNTINNINKLHNLYLNLAVSKKNYTI
ncbi:dephospho-CoA kinase [Candidatus Palibaumannia cicadellinicola]|uniref:Dephospho-CoA kinase n=1 Tax=Candidatus Palibaumannia cicadellinicola TaxID=186490 RepID=A0A0K2BLI4_9GAMM|nr:dephospho-CoA kinase [Candidatus Baumannia cicadellinicola]AKZ66042.1 Dephospho-CoA kinase [Candidatus Baumannia cicadellinicola]